MHQEAQKRLKNHLSLHQHNTHHNSLCRLFLAFFLQIWAKAILKSDGIFKISCFHKMYLYTLSYQSSFSANEETYFIKVMLTIMKNYNSALCILDSSSCVVHSIKVQFLLQLRIKPLHYICHLSCLFRLIIQKTWDCLKFVFSRSFEQF